MENTELIGKEVQLKFPTHYSFEWGTLIGYDSKGVAVIDMYNQGRYEKLEEGIDLVLKDNVKHDSLSQIKSIMNRAQLTQEDILEMLRGK